MPDVRRAVTWSLPATVLASCIAALPRPSAASSLPPAGLHGIHTLSVEVSSIGVSGQVSIARDELPELIAAALRSANVAVIPVVPFGPVVPTAETRLEVRIHTRGLSAVCGRGPADSTTRLGNSSMAMWVELLLSDKVQLTRGGRVEELRAILWQDRLSYFGDDAGAAVALKEGIKERIESLADWISFVNSPRPPTPPTNQ